MALDPTSAGFFGAGAAGGGMESLLNLITQGTKSPLLMEILKPLLAIQARGFPQQQQTLTDQFRAAGALKGGAYGRESSRLLGDQALAKSALIGSTTSGMLGPLLQALLSSQKTAGRGGSSDPWASVPPSLGLQTPMSGPMAPQVGYERGMISPSGPAEPLNLDQLLQMLRQGSSPPTPSYPDAGGIAASYPGQPTNPFSELMTTDYGYLNPEYQEY